MEPLDGLIDVEVAYALPGEQAIVALKMPAGATAGEAIEKSGLLARFAQIDVSRDRVGIFSRPVALDQVLRDGDRVEIYRGLVADPKDARRLRANTGKKPPRR